jgi:DNA polymerase-3 subunit alpha
MPDLPDFSRGERLAWEKELLGLYLSEHPLKPFEPELRRKYRATPIVDLKETQPNQNITIGGLVTSIRNLYTKTGQAMLAATIEDTSGTISVTCFTKTTAEYGKYLIPNAVVAIFGRAQHRERMKRGGNAEEEEGAEEKSVQVEILVDRVEQIIADAMAADARPRELHVHIDGSCKTFLRMIKETMEAHKGGSPLFLHVDIGEAKPVKIRTDLKTDPNEMVIAQVRQMLGGGPQRVWIE